MEKVMSDEGMCRFLRACTATLKWEVSVHVNEEVNQHRSSCTDWGNRLLLHSLSCFLTLGCKGKVICEDTSTKCTRVRGTHTHINTHTNTHTHMHQCSFILLNLSYLPLRLLIMQSSGRVCGNEAEAISIADKYKHQASDVSQWRCRLYSDAAAVNPWLCSLIGHNYHPPFAQRLSLILSDLFLVRS